jgi:hypothetical protein
MDQPLGAFLDHARSKGMDHATIRMLLLSAGWKEKEIARALTEHSLDMPVPTPPDVGGAREAFMHLVAFAALYTAVIALVALVFDFVNLALPDQAMTEYAGPRAEYVRTAIRWEMASLIVSFPLLVVMSRLLLKELRAAPERIRSPVRRWLTYLTLFVAAVALGVDLITLVSSLLEGELSARFLLKVATVFVAAGSCFSYYFFSLRMSPEESQKTLLHRRFGWSAAAVALAVVVAGVVVTGSPVAERVRKFDTRRVEDVRAIYGEVLNISLGPTWRNPQVPITQKRPLPSSLDAVAGGAVERRPRVTDPENGRPYEYQVLNETRFRVCATFGQARDEVRDVAWNHPSGRHCYEFDAMNPIR